VALVSAEPDSLLVVGSVVVETLLKLQQSAAKKSE